MPMPPTLDAVLADALKLSPQERAELAEALADSVLPAPALHPDWEAEIARRVADMDAGRMRFVAADEALAALAARIESRRPRP
jgi:putative addiction module component (TIGR02574 family)